MLKQFDVNSTFFICDAQKYIKQASSSRVSVPLPLTKHPKESGTRLMKRRRLVRLNQPPMNLNELGKLIFGFPGTTTQE